MKRVEETANATYRLVGVVGWMVRRQHDPDYFQGKRLEEEFESPSDASAVGTAREMAALFLGENRDIAPGSEGERGWPRFFRFDLSRTVWDMAFVPAAEGRPAIPEIPSVPGYIRERRLGTSV